MKKELYTLQADSELRLEIDRQQANITVILKSGLAEIFGTELVIEKRYQFTNHFTKVAIFTYHGCKVLIIGDPDMCYISPNTPMVMYINSHAALEEMRSNAKDSGRAVAMVVGPPDVGKSTLCRILTNYAVRQGRRPIYVDLDVVQGTLSMPGTIAAVRVDQPVDVEMGYSLNAPIVYHYGHNTPFANIELYKNILKQMADVILNSPQNQKRVQSSGVIINTAGWSRHTGHAALLEAAMHFKVTVIFVIDQDLLYDQLTKVVPSSVKVVPLPKSGGVVVRNKQIRADEQHYRAKEYFYGCPSKPLYPYIIKLRFNQFKLFAFAGAMLPESCLPIGWKLEGKQMKLIAIRPYPSLLYHMLTVSLSHHPRANVASTPAAGFVCVTEIDMVRRTMTILSPQPYPLPKCILLVSDFQFLDFKGQHIWRERMTEPRNTQHKENAPPRLNSPWWQNIFLEIMSYVFAILIVALQAYLDKSRKT